jgi:hypothetical protein
MTPVINVTNLNDGRWVTTTVDNTGCTIEVFSGGGAADSTVHMTPTQSKPWVAFLANSEEVRALELLLEVQIAFETEMGAELIAYNSQALTKDPVTRVYTQAVTRIAFDSYKKGLDGPPA